MKIQALNKIEKPYFDCGDIAKALGITPGSARVSANRYASQGFIMRVKRGIYVLSQRWYSANQEEKFLIANIAQVPSYVSLMTALEYYGITTQMQRGFIESVCQKRSREFTVWETVLRYTKIVKKLYFGFMRGKGFFIASAEKAFLDAAYLASLGRYSFDITSIDLSKLDKKKLEVLARAFPKRTRRFLESYGCFRKA